MWCPPVQRDGLRVVRVCEAGLCHSLEDHGAALNLKACARVRITYSFSVIIMISWQAQCCSFRSFYALKSGATEDGLTWAVRTVKAFSSWDTESVLGALVIATGILTVAVLKLMGNAAAEAEPLLAMIEHHAEVREMSRSQLFLFHETVRLCGLQTWPVAAHIISEVKRNEFTNRDEGCGFVVPLREGGSDIAAAFTQRADGANAFVIHSSGADVPAG